MNRIEGRVEARTGSSGVQSIRTASACGTFQALVFEKPGTAPWLDPGSRVHLVFKESDVLIARPGTLPWPGAIPARISALFPSEILVRVEMESVGLPVCALVPQGLLEALGLGPGESVEFWVPPHDLVLEGADGIAP